MDVFGGLSWLDLDLDEVVLLLEEAALLLGEELLLVEGLVAVFLAVLLVWFTGSGLLPRRTAAGRGVVDEG